MGGSGILTSFYLFTICIVTKLPLKILHALTTGINTVHWKWEIRVSISSNLSNYFLLVTRGSYGFSPFDINDHEWASQSFVVNAFRPVFVATIFLFLRPSFPYISSATSFIQILTILMHKESRFYHSSLIFWSIIKLFLFCIWTLSFTKVSSSI